jgi:hypothetical protein
MKKPTTPEGADAKLWRDLMDRIEAATGAYRPFELAMAENVATAQATVRRLADATEVDKTKLLISAQTSLRQALRAFDTAMNERAKAKAEPGSPGGPGKKRAPARPGVPTTDKAASVQPKGQTWIDEIRERHQHPH